MMKVCQVCLTTRYTKFNKSRATLDEDGVFFVGSYGFPISARALNETCKKMARRLGLNNPSTYTVHSACLSGTRFYTRLGASRETFAGLGDWKRL